MRKRSPAKAQRRTHSGGQSLILYLRPQNGREPVLLQFRSFAEKAVEIAALDPEDGLVLARGFFVLKNEPEAAICRIYFFHYTGLAFGDRAIEHFIWWTGNKGEACVGELHIGDGGYSHSGPVGAEELCVFRHSYVQSSL